MTILAGLIHGKATPGIPSLTHLGYWIKELTGSRTVLSPRRRLLIVLKGSVQGRLVTWPADCPYFRIEVGVMYVDSGFCAC